MENLLEIKKALADVPDEILESISFGIGECCEEEVSMVASEGDGACDYPEVFATLAEKYPEVLRFNKLIRNIAKTQVIIHDQGKEFDEIEDSLYESGVSSETF